MNIEDRIWEASKTSQAGKDLWNLLNALSDDVSGDELLARLDSYVSDLSQEAQTLYLKLAKESA